MAQDATIISASLNDSELKQSIDNLVNYVDAGTKKMAQSMTNAVEEMKKSLQSLGDTKIVFGGVADGGSSKRKKLQQDETNAVNETSVSYDNLAYSMQKAAQYSDEILKKSKAIRESSEWIETGHYTSGDFVFYDKDRANVSKRERSQLLDLEEQIKNAILQEGETRRMSTKEASMQAQAEQQVAQAARGTQQIYQSIYEMQLRSNEEARKGGIKNTSFANYEDFRQALGGVLGLQRNEVILANEETDAYNKLKATLGQLESAYYKLSSAERESDNGKSLVASIQEVQRAMQKIQAQASRPVNLQSVMGLSEKTLDDIAYKMQMLQRYRSGLNVDTKRNEINQVNRAYDSLKKKMDEVMAKSAQMNTINNALTRSFNYMKNRLAFYFTVGASTALIKQLIDIRSQYELTERSLGILVNSAERGSRIFNELSQMALVSPYTLIELSNAAKQLTAYGVAAKDVVDTTRRLADISAAVGAPVERIAYALGHVQSYGYLTSLQARQFANSGIPLVKELANRYSELEEKLVTTSDVFERMKKKQVSYADVMGVVNKMTDEGGRFFDFQAKQAETLRVRLSNLNLQLNNMYNDIGKSMGGYLNGAIKLSATMFKNWRSISRVLATVITTIGVYKTAIALATLNTKMFGIAATKSFLAAVTGAYGARNAVFLLGKTLASIPFAGWAAAIASVLSYFVFFNNSVEESKQKLDEIQSAFRGLRKEVDNLFVNSIKSNNLGTQLSNLKDMLELAESELGVTIPIKIEDVNESNVKQKLNEAKQTIENYIGFAQVFSEEAVGSKFNESMNEYGSAARKVYYSITESINATISSLQELSDAGKASERDIKILNELLAGQKEDESKVEYLQRIVKLYEELGLLSEKAYSAKWWSFTGIGDNLDELKDKQGNVLDRLGAKNKEIYSSMLDDVQTYYSSSAIAAYQFELQVARVAKKIDINNIPIDQRTLKMEVAINQEASQNNWNEFEKEFARQISNTKYGTTIQISSDSKSEAEKELSEWQKRMQDWCNKNKIEIKFDFNEDESEKSYRERMLQAAKDAKEDYLAKKRQSRIGTATKEEEEGAKKAYELARKKAELAGADLSSLDKEKKKKDHLLDALKQEISLVEKLQGDYDKLTKAGATSSDALLAVRSAYGTTIDLLNKDMKKYGLPELNLDIITSQSPKEQLEYFKELKQQLETSGLGNLDRMKTVEGIIEKLDIKVKEYNLDKVTKGLNNELGKLKEEYELAVEFDANPELGNVFADMIGIDKEELESLPRTYDAFVKKMQERINKMFEENEVEGSFDLTKMLNKEQFDSWVKARGNKLEDNFVKALNDIRVETNKIRQNETKKQVEDWNKLLEKYADYEYQISKIHEDAEREREVARKQGAGDDVINAINNRENKEIARVNFEKFQQSQEWIIATGDLAGLTDKALGLLIDRLEEYKKNAKNLDPKQIRQINSALKTLYNNVRSKNPFKALSITIKENRLRREELEKQLEKDQEAFQKSNEQIEKNGHLSEKDSEARLKLLDRIKKTKEELANLKDLTPEDLTQAIQTITQTASMATGAVTDMMKAFGADEEAVTIVNGVMSSLEKAASFASVGAAIGGVWGAAIGGIIGLFSGLVSSLGDILSGNAAITEQIEKSQRKVAELENTYKNLERAVEDAYGAAKIYTQEVAIQNKKLQLQQLERQLALEESRKSKYRDEDAIISIKGQIIDLRNEIEDMQRDIVNTFLGISDAGSAVENMVEVIINALRQGENAMSGFNESVDDMIANMIKQVISAKIVGPMFDKVWEDIQKHIDERVQNVKTDEIGAFSVVESLQYWKDKLAQFTTKVSYYRQWWNVSTDEDVERIENRIKAGEYPGFSLFDEWRERREKLIEKYEGMLSQAAIPTFDDIRLYGEKLREIAPELEPYIGDIDALLTELGLKKGAEQTLSNLQQGIQGVTEDTAGALEATLNGMSQQVYYQSTLLEQINNTIGGFDFNTQLGVQGEMLLQLQNGYQTMLAMKTMMENWQTPAGNGIRVEML